MTFVIGTAGHVDHGKSSLVRALTGIEPDRWEEEQRRQLTIDLGFAWLALPDGRQVGIVDVPGHEDFIENMLAGVGGIDLAVLVVAADEGIMPQTREHLAILSLLKVPRLIVALTKIDAVDDDELLELVQLEVEELLDESQYSTALIHSVSAHTGAGLDDLVGYISAELDQIEHVSEGGIPRLPIDRVFTLSGFGTIVTGTLLGGKLRVDDTVELQPTGLVGRVRGLQSHEESIQEAQPGNRVAVNLSGISHKDIERGELLSRPGYITPTLLADVQIDYLASAPQPLKHNTEVKVFVGTSEAIARIRLLDGEQLLPGALGIAQLVLQQPLPFLRGQRFILRRPSPPITIGGGVVLDFAPRRKWKRNRPEVRARFDRLISGDPLQLLEQVLLDARRAVHITRELPTMLRSKQLYDVTTPILEQLLTTTAVGVMVIGEYALHTDFYAAKRVQIEKIVQTFHLEQPVLPGIPVSQLQQSLQLPEDVFIYLMDELEADGTIIIQAPVVFLSGFSVSLSDSQQRLLQQAVQMFAQNPYTPPSVKEVTEILGRTLLDNLLFSMQVVRISPDVLLSYTVYAEWVEYARQQLENNEPLTVSAMRDAFQTSRKYALSFLEFLDAHQVTRRVNDVRMAGQGSWDILLNPYSFV